MRITVETAAPDITGFERQKIVFALERETITAATLGTAIPSLSKLFKSFTPSSASELHLSARTADRMAKMSKAVGHLTVELSDGLARFTPHADTGFEFEAILSTAMPNQ